MVLKKSLRGQVPPFIVMDVMREANRLEGTGRDVLHLEVGQPSTGAPSGVIAAAQHALVTDRLGYTEALGIDPLRQRIARYYQDTHDIDLAEDRVIVTTGSSGGFMLAFLSAFDAGDRVALAVETRLAFLEQHREAVHRGLTWLALPQNTLLGARLLYRTVDDIWYVIGDRSADFSFYTKRGLLAGVVGSTTLYWLV